MIGRLKSKEEIASGTLKVVFEVTETFAFKAGQYCFITLPQLKYPDQRGPKRHFSIVNSPNEKGIITFTTRETDSGFKKTLKELPIGSKVQLGPIAGVFVLPYDAQKEKNIPGFKPSQPLGLGRLEPLVFIAGGIGVTPFISMLRYIKEEKLPYKITLIYSNRDQASTAYFGEIQNLKSQIPNFKLILTMTDDPNWTGEKRKIDASFIIRVLRELQSTSIKDYFPNVNNQSYLVAGPPGMVEAVEAALIEDGVNQENVRAENFTGY